MSENTKHFFVYVSVAVVAFGGLCLSDIGFGSEINWASNVCLTMVAVTVCVIIDRVSMRKKQREAALRAAKKKKKNKGKGKAKRK